MKILFTLVIVLFLHACKHPLAIEGEGDIIERLVGHRGCSLEEFQSNGPRCAENEVTAEDYFVDYEAVPRPGWKFVSWQGGTACGGQSVAPFCNFAMPQVGVEWIDAIFPDTVVQPSVAVFERSGSWNTQADIPTVGDSLAPCVIDGRLYVMGGEFKDDGVPGFNGNKAQMYDPATDTWSTIADMPTARIDATASVVNGKCYVIGGSREEEHQDVALATVEEYDPATDSWRARAPLSEVRSVAGSAAVDGKIYVFGGLQVLDIDAPVLATVEIYDPATDSWATRVNMPTPRAALGVAAVNGFIYTVGGLNYALGLLGSDIVERYDPAQDSWSTSTSMPTPRLGLALSEADGALYATGGVGFDSAGNSEVPLRTLEIYDPGSDSWSSGADMSQSRFLHGSATVDGHVYVFGGLTSEGEDTVIGDDDEDELTAMERYTP
jgi:N-acetylneuraminic acid mutarotase